MIGRLNAEVIPIYKSKNKNCPENYIQYLRHTIWLKSLKKLMSKFERVLGILEGPVEKPVWFYRK